MDIRVLIIFILSFTIILNGCKKESNPEDSGNNPSGRTYILNSGSYASNNASISVYDPDNRSICGEAFRKRNGQMLGDTGQDILFFGEDIFISVHGSQTIFVTDGDLKVKRQINTSIDGTRLSPRCLTEAEGKVYVTFYEGYLGEINPSEDYSVRLTQVGHNPDGIAYADGKIYTADSGGLNYPEYGNTVSIVDIKSFVRTGSVVTNVNPALVIASPDERNIYVSSYGNYADIPPALQSIDTETGDIRTLEYNNISSMAMDMEEGLLYILCAGYDQMWNRIPGTVSIYDTASKTDLGTFIKDDTKLPDAYSVSVASDGFVYIGCSDYINTGDVYVFTPEGTLYDKFDSQGINPLKVL